MALTTPNMALISWDLSSDPYDHNQLAANFNTIDAHDHTPGKGPRITTNAIATEAVTNPKLSNFAVSTIKVQDDAITAQQMDRDYVHPVGSIMPWWRPNTLSAIPDGWEIAQGQTLNEGQHDFAGGGSVTLPDLRNRFLLGADVSNTGTGPSDKPGIGQIGGSNERNLSHSHTIPAHDHTIDPHKHTVNAHSHPVPGHTHSLQDHRHVHFYPVANQVAHPDSNLGDWGYRLMNPVDMSGYSAINPETGGTKTGTWPDVYYSATYDTFTRYAGMENRAGTQRYPMIALERLENETPYLNVTTASRQYERFLTYSSPPVNRDGKRVTSTGSTSTETQTSSPETNSVGQTTNTRALTTNTNSQVQDLRPNFVGVIYLIKVRNTLP